MGADLKCEACGEVTVVDVDVFDDMPIRDWWAAKGRKCTRCRAVHPAGKAAQAGPPKPPVWARPLLPEPGTRRRVVYDLLLVCGPRGATPEELAPALGKSEWAARVCIESLAERGLVEFNDAAQVWRIKTEKG